MPPAVLQVLWALIPVLSFGILTPVPFAYAARRLRDRRLWLITSTYTAVWLLALTALVTAGEGVSVAVILALVASIHAFSLRRRVFAEAKPSGWSPMPPP
jgi:NhaP-type Na+/H+ or K+/H+ antiporter